MPDDNNKRPEDEGLTEFWEDIRRPGPPELPEQRTARAHPGVLVIGTSADRILVRIHPDGRLEYGEGYTPDEAAQVFWEAMARRRGDYEARLVFFAAMEQLLLGVGRADIAYETAQRRALALGATEHDKFTEDMSRRNLETQVHTLIEFARGLVRRPS